jgi:ADP-ribose pyrophosphatase
LKVSKPLGDYLALVARRPDLFSNQDSAIRIILDIPRILRWQESQKILLRKDNSPVAWAKIGLVLDDPYVTIIRDLVEFPDHKLGGYLRIINSAEIKSGHGVVIFPIVRQKIVLINNYRHATRSWHLEVPRGFGEPNTPAERQARAEISEEIDGEVDELIELGDLHNNTGLEGNLVKVFLARLRKIGKTDKAQGIKGVSLLTVDELEAKLINSTITDGFTIAAYTLARLKGFI